MTEPTENRSRAVVLGAGGLAGTAWMAGLAAGLRRVDVDLAAADLIVGTSAGAIVGAMLTTGADLDRLATGTRPPEAREAGPPVDPTRLAELFALLGEERLDPAEARRRAGQFAVTADAGPEQTHLARTGALIGARDWSDRPLLVTAVDTETGDPAVWDAASGVPLRSAVASSTALPGVFPPITINGRRYMDGGLRSGTNADLAAGARVLVVIEPLAHMFPRDALRREIDAVGASAVVTIVPDPAAVAAFGENPFDRAAWEPTYQAGVRQAPEAADRLRGAWQQAAVGAG
jgi:NTE family protein